MVKIQNPITLQSQSQVDAFAQIVEKCHQREKRYAATNPVKVASQDYLIFNLLSLMSLCWKWRCDTTMMFLQSQETKTLIDHEDIQLIGNKLCGFMVNLVQAIER